MAALTSAAIGLHVHPPGEDPHNSRAGPPLENCRPRGARLDSPPSLQQQEAIELRRSEPPKSSLETVGETPAGKGVRVGERRGVGIRVRPAMPPGIGVWAPP